MTRATAVGLVLLLIATPAVALGGGATADDGTTDPLRNVRVVDVVPDNRSALTGVHAIEVGSTLLVRGTTNRRPDRAAIDVGVVDGPDADRFGFAVVETWGTDGVWRARLSVPADATPGTYTLRVRIGDDTDYQTFEVVAEKRATLTVRSVSRTAVVVDATLPDGGYVELRADGTVYGVSTYLSPGTHTGVRLPVDAAPTALTAVAVVGTPDRRLDAYTVDGAAVTAAVDRLTVTPTPTVTATATVEPTQPSTATASRTPRDTPTSAATTTDGPGFDTLSTVIALVGATLLASRIR